MIVDDNYSSFVQRGFPWFIVSSAFKHYIQNLQDIKTLNVDLKSTESGKLKAGIHSVFSFGQTIFTLFHKKFTESYIWLTLNSWILTFIVNCENPGLIIHRNCTSLDILVWYSIIPNQWTIQKLFLSQVSFK